MYAGGIEGSQHFSNNYVFALGCMQENETMLSHFFVLDIGLDDMIRDLESLSVCLSHYCHSCVVVLHQWRNKETQSLPCE